MSEINPLNSALMRYQPSPPSVLSRSAPDSLSALSSLANSPLKLRSSSSMENLPFRSPVLPEMAQHLQKVSVMAGSVPESHADRHITLPAEVDQAHHDFAASSQGEDIAWPASALPFHRAEAISDKQRDPDLMFLQKTASQIPHVAEQIYLATVEQQKKTLQAYIRGDSGISDNAAEQAWRYFIVEPSESRCRAFRHIINTSHSFSAADKQRLLQSLQRAQTNNGADLRDSASAVADPVQLPDLPADSLSAETIALLAKFGATQQELQQFRTLAVRTAFIREKLLDEKWYNAEAKLRDLSRDGAIPLEELQSLNKIMSVFRYRVGNLTTFTAKDIKLHGPDKDNPDISDHYNSPQSSKLRYQLYYNYLYSMARIELFNNIRKHNLSLMDTLLTPPKKMGILSCRDNNPRLTKALDNGWEKRSTFLMNNMPIMPFVFDISGERPEAARAVAPYGDKGLPVSFFDNTISNPNISLLRLACIGLYSTLEMVNITHTGTLPLDWMAPFSDATLARIFTPRQYPDEPAFNESESFICKLRAMQAIGEVGRKIIPGYGHGDLGKLLAWIKPSLGYEISDDDLAYCLFTDLPEWKLYLCVIAQRIARADYPENNISYPTESIANDIISFCRDMVKLEASQPLLPAEEIRLEFNKTLSPEQELRMKFNNTFSPDQALRLIAQRLEVRLILEDREGHLQRWYDIGGNSHTEPSVNTDEGFIIRPGTLIPLDHHGVQQATLELEHRDNHSLLAALIDYRRETVWRNRPERQEEIFQLEAEFVALTSATADDRERTDVRNQSA